MTDHTPVKRMALMSIEQVNVPRAADVLADSLRQKVYRGELKVGAELPPERELAERAGVSRATVREALRLLERDGLLATKVGRNGGSEITRPTVDSVERSLRAFIHGRDIRLASILETRAAIEAPAARYAAIHRTEEDLDEIEHFQLAMETASRDGDWAAYVHANLDWHVRVVRASHNELLDAFMSAIAQPFLVASDVKEFDSSEIRSAGMQAHRSVMDAIRRRDTEAAFRRMNRHVDAYIIAVGKVGEPAVIRQRGGRFEKAD
jgi:GntR family transcriptional repressor for pyruvate dehydrogenase complex